MNAPVSEVRLADDKLELLPIAAIAPSETPSQARRRRRYTAAALAELAASIRAVGIMQPVVVRKLAALRGLAAYELVAGERRWLASEQAGVAHIPAIVREDITDADLVALQYIENKQRETIDPLQEAETFQDLMEGEGGKSAEDLADLLGVSRAHIYNRRKLLKLQPAVLDALEAGRIDHTKALRISRTPAAKLQRKALEKALETDHRGNQVSDRELGEWMRERLMVRLDGAPFALDDKNMVTKKPGMFACQDSAQRNLPPCTLCENCSKSDPDFDLEIQAAYGDDAVVCADKPCHDTKVLFFFERKLEVARADGRTILEGEQAKAIKQRQHARDLAGYINLDEEYHGLLPVGLLQELNIPADRNPTYRELLKKFDSLGEAAILVDPFNQQPLDVLPNAFVAKLMKKAGLQFDRSHVMDGADAAEAQRDGHRSTARPTAPAGDNEDVRREREKQQARELLELAFRRKLLDQVHAKWRGPLKRDDLQAIADRWLEEQDAMNLPLYDWYYAGRIDTAKMNERELTRLLLELALWSSAEYPGDAPTALITVAKRLKIDPAKVRKQAKAELGGEPEADEKAAPKKKARKK